MLSRMSPLKITVTLYCSPGTHMSSPSDDEIMRALSNLARNTRLHYQKYYRDYCAGDHRPAKKYIYDLVMRKVNDSRRVPRGAPPAGRMPSIQMPTITPTVILQTQLISAVGLFTLTALAFLCGMAFDKLYLMKQRFCS